MAIQNTSLTFFTTGQSSWSPNTSDTELRIDTLDTLFFEINESKDLGVSGWNTSISAELYLEGQFGLRAYAYLNTTGTFEATYEVDVNVVMDNAVITDPDDGIDTLMTFDFSDYTITSTTLETIGFGVADNPADGFGAGLEISVSFAAGVRNLGFYGPIPGGIDNYSYGTVSLFDEAFEGPTVFVDGSQTSKTFEIPDSADSTIYLARPTGANISATVEDSNIVSGKGTSDDRFFEYSGDLDKLLTEMMEAASHPFIVALGKALSKSVFYEESLKKGGFDIAFTAVDVQGVISVSLVEEFSIDLNRSDQMTPNIRVQLTSDMGTPDDLSDDQVSAIGYLGDTLTIVSPESQYGYANIRADYWIEDVTVNHTIGFDVSRRIEVSILQGKFGGSIVPSFLEFSFGPVKTYTFPDDVADIDDPFNTLLPDLVDQTFTVDGDVFNSESDAYQVFYVDDRLTPDSWSTASPSAGEVLLDYFESSLEQVAAASDVYSELGFNVVPTATPTDLVQFFDDYDPVLGANAGKVLYVWTPGLGDGVIYLQGGGGVFHHPDDRILVDPTPLIDGDVIDLSVGIYSRTDFLDGNGIVNWNRVPDVSFDSSVTDKLGLLNLKDTFSSFEVFHELQVRYTFDGTYVQSHEVFNVNGDIGGDVLFYHFAGRDTTTSGGDFFNGGDDVDLGGWRHDVFIGDFSHWTTALTWNLAEAVGRDADSDPDNDGVVLTGGDGVNTETITIQNVEAIVIRTGSGDDFIVASTESDYIDTGAGDDLVKLQYAVSGSDKYVDYADDTVVLGSGNDIALVEIGNFSSTDYGPFTDHIYGGTGVDQLFVRTGVQGLKFDFYDAGTASYLFGGEGIGSTAFSWELDTALAAVTADWNDNYDTYADDATGNNSHYLLLNNSSLQGRVEIGLDVEHISIGGDASGPGDDLLIFLGGVRYDGGDGIDTFAADFESMEGDHLDNRGGVTIKAGETSFFGETVIENIEKLHVYGTSGSDIIVGGAFYDTIHGGGGDDILYGGVDDSLDVITGGDGNDILLWQDDGNDYFDGNAGFDTVNIGAYQTSITLDDGYVASGGHQYEFYVDGAWQSAATPGTLTIAFAEQVFAWAANNGSQRSSFGGDNLQYQNVEAVNIVGSEQASDLMVYQGGTRYDFGEKLDQNDKDTFFADFSDQSVGINFYINDPDDFRADEGYYLANKIFVRGIEVAAVKGGSGQDQFYGGQHGDVFFGGAGNDILHGKGGNDHLDGQQGSDIFLYDNDGKDVIIGGTEDDNSYVDGVLVQNTAEDDHLIIYGSSGHTRVKLQDENGVQLLTSYSNQTWGDSSNAELKELAELSLTAHTWKYYTTTPSPSNREDSSAQHVTYSEIEKVDISGQDDYDDLIVYQRGEVYTGGERDGDNDVFVGDFRGETADLFFDANYGSGIAYDIGQGTHIADFERFNVLMGSGNDVFRGGDGDDGATGGDGNDRFIGRAGNDVFDGEGGNDSFDHDTGNDVIDGGTGLDTLSISVSDAITAEALDAGGAQLEALSAVSGMPSSGDIADFIASSPSAIRLTHGSNSVKFAEVEEVLISGSSFNDVLVGGSGDSAFFAGDGLDLLLSGAGNDFLSGGADSDTYAFGANFGTDTIFGETTGSSRILFTTHSTADLSFENDGLDLLVTSGSDSLRIVDYFRDDQRLGLNFIFETTDGFFTKDFLDLGVTPGADRIIGVTETGTESDDVFRLGERREADVYRGFEGNDFFLGDGGGDLFDGGSGADAVSYELASEGVNADLSTGQSETGTGLTDYLVSIERLIGSQFDDVLVGSDLANAINGRGGNDVISGLAGDDLLTGEAGDDTIHGGEGTDTIYGNDDNDTLNGGDDADVIFGGAGDDTVNGDDGNDVLEGGEGDDTVDGGDGDDLVFYTSGFDTLIGGLGNDTLWFDLLDVAVDVDLTSVAITYDLPTLDAVNGTLRTLATVAGFENVVGTIYDDRVTGDAGANQLEGGLGDDLLTGREGDDILVGGGGFDMVDFSRETGGGVVYLDLSAPGSETATDTYGDSDILSGIEGAIGSSGIDIMFGNAENNQFYGMGEHDDLHGGDGNDVLIGGDGGDSLLGDGDNDFLAGGADGDLLNGGAGDDVLQGDDDGQAGSDDTLHGGEGWDTLSYEKATTDLTITVSSAGVGTVVGEGTDTFTGIEVILGGLGNDTFNGSADSETFAHVGGLDTMTGGLGIDTASFSYFQHAVRVDLTQTDTAVTGDADTVPATGLRVIARLSGIEAVVGSAFNDELLGDGEANMLMGGSGDDLLDGGTGSEADALFGDGGNDTFISRVGAGADQMKGGDGIDTLSYASEAAGVVASLVDGDGDDTLYGVERLVGSAFADQLSGDDDTNILFGGEGDDTVSGGGGADILVQSGGVDTFEGGDGIDTIDLSDQASAVTVQLASLTEMVQTNDTASASDPVAVNRVIGMQVQQDIENVIGSDFDDNIYGNASDNMFNGGLGYNAIYGIEGNNTFVHGGGRDYWYGGTGIDTAVFANAERGVEVELYGAARYVPIEGQPVEFLVFDFDDFENIIGSMFDDVLKGGFNSELDGLAGDDVLEGWIGVDVLKGSDGNDILEGGDGADELLGGTGIDTALYENSAVGVTVNLTTGTGTGGEAEGDTLTGIENITGSGEIDDLTGDDKENVLKGGAGDDVLNGKGGMDYLNGGLGADVLDGGEGFDFADYSDSATGVIVNLETGTGTGEAAGDTFISIEGLKGSSFDDILTGTSEADALHGNEGADQLNGAAGVDLLNGGDGDDTLDGGADIDVMIGGLGNDRYYVDDEKDSAVEAEGEGTGDAVYSTVNYTLADWVEYLILLGADDLTGFGNAQANSIYGNTGENQIFGLDGDDNIRGGAGADVLKGGEGSDFVLYNDSTVGVTVSLVEDGDGFQSASGGTADGDVISGFEKVYGSSYVDHLTGNDGANQLIGGAGDDTLLGGDGYDILRGDAGADTLNGGNDTDWVLYYGSTAGVTVSLVEDGGGFQSATGGHATGDVISGFERVWGTTFDDDLTGNAADNYLLGDEGADTLNGGDGDDILRGGAGADILDGGNDSDFVAYNTSSTGIILDLSGSQTVSGGDGDGDQISGFENVVGSDYNDLIFGDDEANLLLGLGGDDSLIGRGGNDTIRGGAGADTMYGGSGNDWLQYVGSSAGVTVDLTADGSGFQSASGGDAEGDVINGFEHVYGSSHDDDLRGGDTANVLIGGDGDDTINGGGSTDYLRGDAGTDKFVFDTTIGGGNIDTIADFSVGEDVIHLDAAIFSTLSAGALTSAAFTSNADGTADGFTAQIIYETDTGALSYDADGIGGAAAIQFATLTSGLIIDQDSFLVI